MIYIKYLTGFTLQVQMLLVQLCAFALPWFMSVNGCHSLRVLSYLAWQAVYLYIWPSVPMPCWRRTSEFIPLSVLHLSYSVIWSLIVIV